MDVQEVIDTFYHYKQFQLVYHPRKLGFLVNESNYQTVSHYVVEILQSSILIEDHWDLANSSKELFGTMNIKLIDY